MSNLGAFYLNTAGSSNPYGSLLESDPRYMWQDDAACAFMDPLKFEAILLGSQRAKGLSEAERLRKNYENFQEAEAACAKCPVLQECRDAATPEDFQFTFRAGLVPRNYSGNRRGRPTKAANLPKGRIIKDECAKGHKGPWRKKKNRGRECVTCINIRSAEYRLRNGAKPLNPETYKKRYGTPDPRHGGIIEG